MSMTRAEAIDWFEQVRDIAKRNLGEKWTRGCEKHYQLKVDLAEAALAALRFPTREMVERMRPLFPVRLRAGGAGAYNPVLPSVREPHDGRGRGHPLAEVEGGG